MRILVICPERAHAETIARRLAAGDGHQIVLASGFESVRTDVGGFDAMLVWHALFQALEGRLLHAYTVISRRMPVVAVLSREAWSEQRPKVMFADGWLFLDDERMDPAVIVRLAAAGYWVLPEFVVCERLSLTSPRLAEGAVTSQQQSLLEQLGAGRTNREIAAALGLSEARVKRMVGELIGRLGFDNRTQVAVFAALTQAGGSEP